MLVVIYSPPANESQTAVWKPMTAPSTIIFSNLYPALNKVFFHPLPKISWTPGVTYPSFFIVPSPSKFLLTFRDSAQMRLLQRNLSRSCPSHHASVLRGPREWHSLSVSTCHVGCIIMTFFFKQVGRFLNTRNLAVLSQAQNSLIWSKGLRLLCWIKENRSSVVLAAHTLTTVAVHRTNQPSFYCSNASVLPPSEPHCATLPPAFPGASSYLIFRSTVYPERLSAQTPITFPSSLWHLSLSEITLFCVC